MAQMKTPLSIPILTDREVEIFNEVCDLKFFNKVKGEFTNCDVISDKKLATETTYARVILAAKLHGFVRSDVQIIRGLTDDHLSDGGKIILATIERSVEETEKKNSPDIDEMMAKVNKEGELIRTIGYLTKLDSEVQDRLVDKFFRIAYEEYMYVALKASNF